MAGQAIGRRRPTRISWCHKLWVLVLLAEVGIFSSPASTPTAAAAAYSRYFSTWTPTSGTYCASPTVVNNGWLDLIELSVNNWNNIATYARPTFSYSRCGTQQVGIATASLSESVCGTTGTTMSNGIITHAEIRLRPSNSQYWNSVPNGQCNFRWTMTHEFGHAIGLRHSCVTSAVMYTRDNAGVNLTSDDVYAHRWAYTPWGGPPSPDVVQC